MDEYKQRRTKSDKAKEKYERNGSHTSKHVRMIEQLKEKKKST
jgi:hypothetical protein